MHEVFISYARAEKTLAAPIHAALRAAGVSTWIDEQDIPVSVPWLEEVTQAIRGAALVLVLETLAWHSSENCAVELRTAEDLGKEIVYVDPTGESPDAALEKVRTRLSGLPDEAFVRAELLSRSHRWVTNERGRAGEQLASGRTLRAYRRLASSSGIELDLDSRRFIAASRRRARRRQIVSLFVISALLFLVATPSTLKKIQSEADKIVTARSEATFERQSSVVAADVNGYLALESTLAVTKDSDNHFFARYQLARAMSIRLPSGVTRSPAGGTTGRPAPRAPKSSTGLRAEAVTETGHVDVTDRASRLLRNLAFAGKVDALAWSPDDLLAVADEEGVEVMDIRRGSQRAQLRGVKSAVKELRWEGNDTVVAVTAEGLRVTWHLRDTTYRDSWRPGWYMGVAVNDTGLAAAVSRRGALRLIDPAGRSRARSVRLRGSGTAVDIAAAERLFLVIRSASGRSLLIIVDPAGSQRVVPLTGCSASVVAFQAAERAALVACGDRGYARVDLQTNSVRYADSRLLLAITTIAAIPDGVLLGNYYSEFSRVDRSGRETSVRFGNPLCPLWHKGIVGVPGRNQFFIGGPGAGMGMGCAARLTWTHGAWTSDAVMFFGYDAYEARGLTVSRDGRHFAYGFSDGTVWVASNATLAPELIAKATGSEIRGVDFTPDGSRLVAATRDGEILVFSPGIAGLPTPAVRAELRRRLQLGIDSGLYHNSGRTWVPRGGAD